MSLVTKETRTSWRSWSTYNRLATAAGWHAFLQSDMSIRFEICFNANFYLAVPDAQTGTNPVPLTVSGNLPESMWHWPLGHGDNVTGKPLLSSFRLGSLTFCLSHHRHSEIYVSSVDAGTLAFLCPWYMQFQILAWAIIAVTLPC